MIFEIMANNFIRFQIYQNHKNKITKYKILL